MNTLVFCPLLTKGGTLIQRILVLTCSLLTNFFFLKTNSCSPLRLILCNSDLHLKNYWFLKTKLAVPWSSLEWKSTVHEQKRRTFTPFHLPSYRGVSAHLMPCIRPCSQDTSLGWENQKQIKIDPDVV